MLKRGLIDSIKEQLNRLSDKVEVHRHCKECGDNMSEVKRTGRLDTYFCYRCDTFYITTYDNGKTYCKTVNRKSIIDGK